MAVDSSLSSIIKGISAAIRSSGGVRVSAVSTHINTPTFRTPKPPTAIPLYEIILKLPKLFPLTTSQSFADYKLFKGNQDALQTDLLSTLPFYLSDAGDKCGKVIRTPIDSEGNYINEFCVSPLNANSAKMNHLILIHGYGAGLGFFLKTFEHLPLLNNSWTLHAIDLPGYGYSSRPPFPFKVSTHSSKEVEDWFFARLDRWFEKRGLLNHSGRNLVVAHSMGAYLAALYAQSRNNHFDKLVMCSPAGICPTHRMFRPPPWWFERLWDYNVSPFSLVRNSGPFGSKLTSGWSHRRFRQLLDDGPRGKMQFDALHRYSYSIFNQPGSGEYLLSFALKCGGDPRQPLLERIFNSKALKDFKAKCDWLWLYGDNDWMNKSGGYKASSFINEHAAGNSSVELVPESGHNLYFDNYRHFNSILVREMENIMRKSTGHPL